MIQKANTAVICLSLYQGGMELDALHLSQMFSEISEVTLIAKKGTFIAQTFLAQEENHGVSLHAIDFKRSLSYALFSEVRQIIKEKNIKNVLFLGASELKSLYFSFLGLEINLIIRHGTTKSTPKKDWFHRLIYSDVHYHIAICEHLGRNVEKIIPFGPKTKLKVIYPSLNLTPKTKIDFKKRPHQPLQILHVGRIADGKGQITALKACEVLFKNNINFVFNIAGGFDTPFKAHFLEYLETLEYKEHINLIGHTSEIESHYLNNDIFLFPSEGEGLSNAFIEAMVYGLTAITFDNTSFPELQNLGFSFKLVEDQNIEALQEALLESVLKYREQINNNQENALLSRQLFSKERELLAFSKLLK